MVGTLRFAAIAGLMALTTTATGAGTATRAEMRQSAGAVASQGTHADAITAPTALTVASASRSAVALSWTSSDAAAKVVVERKLLGSAWPAVTAAIATPTMPTPSTVLVVTGTTVSDAKIDPYATYVYRVRSQDAGNTLSAPSNEMTVGPPPVGFTSVIAAPKAMQAHDKSQFANQIKLAFDANNDPMIAYATSDLNDDGELDDTELSVITWNRARYRWNAPVAIDTVGNIVRSGTRFPFSIARDESTGKIGVVHMFGDHEVRLSTSDDAGVTWKRVQVARSTGEEPVFSTPSVALAGGHVYLAYAFGSSVRYRTGLATDPPSKWTSANAPLIAGASDVRSECVNVALDAGARPVVSYCLNGDSYMLLAALWHPDGGGAIKILDSSNHQNDDPGLHMAISGATVGVALYGARDNEFFNNHHIWYAHSTNGGASFSTPVAVADDGGNGMGAPLTVMVDKTGKPALLANVDGGNDGAAKCGIPKLMRSVDGVKWSTCAPETKGIGEGADPVSPSGGFAGNDKLYIAFKARQGIPSMVPGLVLWRER